jgi:L-seryl-tRNA(Ser) seleniumtransferase
MNDLRLLPSVEHILQSKHAIEWISKFGRPLTLDAIRFVLNELRSGYKNLTSPVINEEIICRIESTLTNWTKSTLTGVINATGVILHTNLGRSPLSVSAITAIQLVSAGYSNLEYDLSSGRRGERSGHIESLLVKLTGADAALVVNNNASAVLLSLIALAKRRRVVIARSQLVEIGGGFRIPDVMKQSGAKLVEIGTTNRVHLQDYKDAINSQPVQLVLHAHHSNFKIIGFTTEPSLKDIVSIAHHADIPVVDDLGSGALLDTAEFGLGHEPMVQESLAAGVDLVCFSGDKLIGGPQSGIILGKSDLIIRLKKHPLTRAIRADKLCLAALSSTLIHYLLDEAVTKIPVWMMISAKLDSLEDRVNHWIEQLGVGEILSGQSTVGGGSLPGETLPTRLFAISTSHPDRFVSRLREAEPPVIARLENNRVLFDPRTVLPEQDPLLITSIKQAQSEFS